MGENQNKSRADGGTEVLGLFSLIVLFFLV